MLQGKFFGNFLAKAMNKEIGWLTDDIKVMLCKDTYVPNKSHEYLDDITNEITTNASYPAGGYELENKSVNYVALDSKLVLDADDIVVNDADIADARYAVIYCDTGTPATSPLIGYIDFLADKGVTNGVFKLIWSGDGLFVHTV
jgi:hypothetical protein